MPQRQKTIRDQIPELGTTVDEVVLQVDYQIIEHFSENLYGSPNKAVEELVANGFDAFASEVHVFIPGPQSPSRLLVWDNGESMDIEGLKALWWIARSPKDQGDRIRQRDGKARKMIGKFGIGKLASYSVGRVISHLCRHQEEFYLVSVDYAQIHGDVGQPPISLENPLRTPVVSLLEASAKQLLESLFEQRPTDLDRLFSSPSWTLAIVEDLKVEDLPKGRLMWVLGNGMPLRPDFAIWVNEEKVTPKLEKEAVIEWDLGSEQVVATIKARWEEAVRDSEFDPPVEFGSELGLDPQRPTRSIPFARFAYLGKVWSTIRLFDETLLKYRSADHGRSYGFFLLIRGRLVNPDEAELLLGDPSFGTFYRAQFILHADDLDHELLADRERLRSDRATAELKLLQSAIYVAARVQIETRDAERQEEQSTKSILPLGSRPYYRAPLNALLMRTPVEQLIAFDPARPKVERKPIGEDDPIAIMAFEEGAFQVNTLHPYFTALEKRIGKSRATREFLRSFDLFAISERLLEGHLYELGLDDEEVQEVVAWREGLFRQLAKAYDEAPEVVNEMFRTSSVGDRPFERALQRVFEDMGLAAYHDGETGKKDILVVAAVGPESYSFSVEAKGSKGKVNNREAAVGAAVSHRDAVGAKHAVIVAREFAGFERERQEEPALLQECRSAGGVSIMETDAIAAVHEAIDRFSYPLPMLRDVFTALESPAQKMERITALAEPTKGFDYAELLQECWRRQGSEAAGDSLPYKAVYQQGHWRNEMEFSDFERRLTALDTLAAGRVQLLASTKEIYLRQSPDLILAQIERSLRGEGHDIPEQETHG